MTGTRLRSCVLWSERTSRCPRIGDGSLCSSTGSGKAMRAENGATYLWREIVSAPTKGPSSVISENLPPWRWKIERAPEARRIQGRHYKYRSIAFRAGPLLEDGEEVHSAPIDCLQNTRQSLTPACANRPVNTTGRSSGVGRRQGNAGLLSAMSREPAPGTDPLGGKSTGDSYGLEFDAGKHQDD